MGKSGKMNIASLRKLVGIVLILILLLIFCSLYFLKYLPSRQEDFHHSAFRELKQVETSLQERNKAYIQAIQNSLNRKDSSLPLLNKFFRYTDYSKKINPKSKGIDSVKDITIDEDVLNRKWRISYNAYRGNVLVKTFSKSLDSLMTSLVGNYKEIFDDYLVISDKYLPNVGGLKGEMSKLVLPSTVGYHNGQILFNSGSLSVDFLVNTDSLLKKTDGFSLLNVHDVTIEGNPYKLFLYPMALGQQRIILSGLISLDRYNAEFKKIPFNLIALTGVLILLILILLPILKIYILGPHERITAMDIRFIIGTYFIAAFLGFFLFSNSFLNKAGPVKNKRRLQVLSAEIQQSLISEIDSMCTQLRIYDSSFYSNAEKRDSVFQILLQENTKKIKDFPKESAFIDTIFKPCVYPYLNNFFWIGSDGKWLARWAFKKLYTRTPLIDVSDRQYFNDFINRETLTLPDKSQYQFTIQPTLSKLDGEYIITVVIPSDTSHRKKFTKKWKTDKYPLLVGMGAEMHFVSRALLPQGHNFSIINDAGDILYDSKSGLALLSNILQDVDNPIDILQCSKYRNARYFSHMMLRGRQVDMLATPIKGFPYTLLTYSKISQTEDTNEHLIGLSAVMMSIILTILLFSAWVNEWSKKRNTILHAPRLYFEWLHPAASKVVYYRHLIIWMSLLLMIYLLSWFTIEYLFRASEFSLFFVSMLFPFYVAIHYYVARENYYLSVKKKESSKQNDNTPPLLYPRPLLITALLLAVLIIINCFTINFSGNYIPVLLTQFLFLFAIGSSIWWLKKMLLNPSGQVNGTTNHNTDASKCKDSPPFEKNDIQEENKPGECVKSGPDDHEKTVNEKSGGYTKFLNLYSIAILTGVALISIFPACGIFCLLLRQETNLESVNTQLELAHMINLRRIDYNQRIKDYNFPDTDAFYLNAFYKLKFQSGIYTFSGDSVSTIPVFEGKINQNVSQGYSQLHHWFFPEGSISSRVDSPSSASDSSWYFLESTDDKKSIGSELVYRNNMDAFNKDSVIQKGTIATNRNATELILHQISLAGPLYMALFFGGLILIVFCAHQITKSIAKRIFLIDFKEFENNCEMRKALQHMLKFRDADCDKVKKDLPNKGNEQNFILRVYDHEKDLLSHNSESGILSMGKLMENIYWGVWVTLSAREKFLLYDFAVDGFANYRGEKLLYGLMQKGLIRFDDSRLVFMTFSFREFVLDNHDDADVISELTRAANKDSWKQFKIPLLLVLSLIGLFIFVTQDMIYQKVTGLLTSLGSLLPLFTSLFSDSNGSNKENQE